MVRHQSPNLDFTYNSDISLLISLSFSFVKGRKGQNSRAHKNDITPPKRLHRERSLLGNASSPGARLEDPASFLFPLVFFQCRGADSPDTIIPLYCRADSVVCKGFPRTVQGPRKVSHTIEGTQSSSLLHVKGTGHSRFREPRCAAWQVWFKMLPPFSLVTSRQLQQNEQKEKKALSERLCLWSVPKTMDAAVWSHLENGSKLGLSD